MAEGCATRQRPGVQGAGNFGACRGQACSRPHTGEDVTGTSGVSAVNAATSGTVVFSGWKKGYGDTIVVDAGNGVTTQYSHTADKIVQEGDTVQQGDIIGIVGQSGNALGQPESEAHVHFEVKENGVRVDPAVWLNLPVDFP